MDGPSGKDQLATATRSVSLDTSGPQVRVLRLLLQCLLMMVVGVQQQMQQQQMTIMMWDAP